MSLTAAGSIETPDSQGTAFDHGAFEPETRHVFISHTARDSLEVVDVDTSLHVATLRGFPEAAGVAAGDGYVLVTNRGSASAAWVDARTLEARAVLNTTLLPNGAAIVWPLQAMVVACMGATLSLLEMNDISDHAVILGSSQIGATPEGWTATLTGKGDSKWTVESDEAAPVKISIGPDRRNSRCASKRRSNATAMKRSLRVSKAQSCGSTLVRSSE